MPQTGKRKARTKGASTSGINSPEAPGRRDWPLYFIVTKNYGLRVIEHVVLVTADFVFARSVCSCLGKSFFNPCIPCKLEIVRAADCDRCYPVGQQASNFMNHFDRNWSQAPDVTSEAFCSLLQVGGEIHGVRICSDASAPWPLHLTIEKGTEQKLRLNVLNEGCFPTQAQVEAAQKAIHLAKVDWTGRLYFFRAMRSRLPVELSQKIVRTCPELESPPSSAY